MRATRATAWCALLSLIGVGLSGYLSVIHFGLLRGELLGGAACGTGAFNCHAVTAGAYGVVRGMPLALWGVLGYFTVLALSLLGRQSADWAERAMTLIFLLVGVFVGIDALLLILMVFVIRYYCLFCLLTYAVNLLLLVIAARSLGYPWPASIRRAGPALAALVPSSQRPAAWLFWGMMGLVVFSTAGLNAATTFVSRGPLGAVRTQLREFVSSQSRVSVDVASDPATGPATAPIQIVEFSDLLCPACQRASKLNTIILAGHRHDTQLVFKHFPLDMSCNETVTRMVHPGACRLAAATECAHLQGKFWALHDRIFAEGPHYNPAHLEEDAQRAGLDLSRFDACLTSGEGLEAVKRDIAEAVKIGVTSTPTYVINGLRIAGGLSPSVFEDLVDVLHETGR